MLRTQVEWAELRSINTSTKSEQTNTLLPLTEISNSILYGIIVNSMENLNV